MNRLPLTRCTRRLVRLNTQYTLGLLARYSGFPMWTILLGYLRLIKPANPRRLNGPWCEHIKALTLHLSILGLLRLLGRLTVLT